MKKPTGPDATMPRTDETLPPTPEVTQPHVGEDEASERLMSDTDAANLNIDEVRESYADSEGLAHILEDLGKETFDYVSPVHGQLREGCRVVGALKNMQTGVYEVTLRGPDGSEETIPLGQLYNNRVHATQPPPLGKPAKMFSE